MAPTECLPSACLIACSPACLLAIAPLELPLELPLDLLSSLLSSLDLSMELWPVVLLLEISFEKSHTHRHLDTLGSCRSQNRISIFLYPKPNTYNLILNRA